MYKEPLTVHFSYWDIRVRPVLTQIYVVSCLPPLPFYLIRTFQYIPYNSDPLELAKTKTPEHFRNIVEVPHHT